MADSSLANEETLINALQRREEAAFAFIFEQYADRLYRLALGLLNDQAQADGVVQETFITLFEHIDTFGQRAQLSTWLYRVTYNNTLMRLRRHKPSLHWHDMEDEDVMPDCLVDWASLPEQIVSSSEAIAEMQRAIDGLSPPLRVVFTLRDVEELSTAETAEVLGVSEAVVKVRLHRARLLLRERLAGYFEQQISI